MAVADNVVLTHTDADGVGCAALLKMSYGIDSRNIFFAEPSKEDFEKATQRILKLCGPGTTVYVTDLCVNESLINPLSGFVKTVKRKGGSVVWLDHHPWSEFAIDKIARECRIAIVGENSCACATDIVMKYTGLDGSFVRKFVDIVHNIDFATRQKGAWAIRMGRSYSSGASYLHTASYGAKQMNLRHMVDVIASGRFIDGRIREAASRYDALSRSAIASMLKTVRPASRNVAVGFSYRRLVDSNDACAAIREKSHSDVAIFIKTLRYASIRSGKSDVSKLAAAFGGGGHPHASGFIVPRGSGLESEKGRKLFVNRIGRKAMQLGIG
jgi:oligoribonuclease NrnB/cAMP/cGMP phosphodiesterase (DHH superfamily)